MIDTMAVYDCHKCGKVLEDGVESFNTSISCSNMWEYQEIDHINDDCYWHLLCRKCNGHVAPRKTDGVQHFEKVSHSRWLAAQGYFDEH